MHYSIEWKVLLNDKQVSQKVRAQRRARAYFIPAGYILRPHLEGLVEKKLGHVQNVQPYETSIVTTISARGEHDLTNEFKGLDVDWEIVSSQLMNCLEGYHNTSCQDE